MEFGVAADIVGAEIGAVVGIADTVGIVGVATGVEIGIVGIVEFEAVVGIVGVVAGIAGIVGVAIVGMEEERDVTPAGCLPLVSF